MPSGQYILPTVSSLPFTYVAPANGWVICAIYGVNCHLYVMGGGIEISMSMISNANWIRICSPIKKGTSITMRGTGGTISNQSIKFVYADGEV